LMAPALDTMEGKEAKARRKREKEGLLYTVADVFAQKKKGGGYDGRKGEKGTDRSLKYSFRPASGREGGGKKDRGKRRKRTRRTARFYELSIGPYKRGGGGEGGTYERGGGYQYHVFYTNTFNEGGKSGKRENEMLPREGKLRFNKNMDG